MYNRAVHITTEPTTPPGARQRILAPTWLLSTPGEAHISTLYLVTFTCPEEGLLATMRQAVAAFLATEQGHTLLAPRRRIEGGFDWNHALWYIPQDFWREHAPGVVRVEALPAPAWLIKTGSFGENLDPAAQAQAHEEVTHG